MTSSGLAQKPDVIKSSTALENLNATDTVEVVVYEGRWKEGLPAIQRGDYVEIDKFKNFEFCSIFGEDVDIMWDANGNVYFGGRNEIKKFHGKGVCKYRLGYSYFGDFSNNLWNGSGKLYNDSGIIYKGQFFRASFEGEGTMYLGKNARYRGLFHKGHMHGKGTLYYSDGREYEGFFKKSLKNGKGVWRYKDGSTMETLYEGGQIKGKAVHIKKGPNGQEEFYLRTYVNGLLVSQKKSRKKPSLKSNCCRIF